MKGSIRVSPKHGVNPSMGVCFWCGEDDGTILLLGRLPEDREAARRTCATLEPCKKCKTNMALGITLAEATGPGEPTGKWLVITEDCARRVFSEPMLSRILKSRKAFVEPEAFGRFQPRKEGEA
jgi:hypothetical protein